MRGENKNMSAPTEKRFETHIEESLNKAGYHSLPPADYDRELCLIPDEVIGFIQETQPEQWEKLTEQYGDTAGVKILRRISDEVSRRGVTDVFRNGVKDRGVLLRLVFFRPNSGLNPDHRELYRQNSFAVIRQLKYSRKNENSLDMVLFLNGLPVLTMELKNRLSGQTIADSELQYKKDRDPGEPLFHFTRCAVHFCADNDRVSMTTALAGEKTRFLPYNKGIENPVNPDGYRTSYLWEEVLVPDSLLDILENFIHLAEETEAEWDNYKGKVVEKTKKLLVFPRYHQLEVIRKLRRAVKDDGPGHNYLIQHTTGSGKSYSIGWLAHLLTSLYKTGTDTRRIFDSIIVVTDRVVLDKQLQNTIMQLEQTKGVVGKVESGSRQLKDFLKSGKDIIVTTIQKFPYISAEMTKLGSRSFAVIIDEVHSSQSGENAKHLKKALSQSEAEADDTPEDYGDTLLSEIAARGKQKHISFFGFTGTPKNKTLELFGTKHPDGTFRAFHYYTMEQSIAEGFTLDVIRNYTTYKRYFKLIRKEGEDKEVPEGKAKLAMIQYVDSHPETIERKAAIILDHFTGKASKMIGGKARGMVVVRSRMHCVFFFKEMVKQIRMLGLPWSCLVAFSGKIDYEGTEVTEDSLNRENGLPAGVSIAKGLKDPKFRILIVSNKFQTGYDEPLLQAMYIDKKMDGIQCVQTLSRLNRVTAGKTDTFVLDFINGIEDVIEAFQPFYTITVLSGETDPNKLYDIETELLHYHLFSKSDVEDFCRAFYTARTTDEQLQPYLDRVVKRWEELGDEEEKHGFKSQIQSYIRLYGYISQIVTFKDPGLEELYIFLKYLNRKLPKNSGERVNISDAVELESLRIQKLGETRGTLVHEPGVVDPISAEAGGRIEDETELLSEIIKKINEVFGQQLTEEHKIMFRNVRKRLHENETLQKFMAGDNSETNKRKKFMEILNATLLSYVNHQFDFYQKLEDPRIKNLLVDEFFRNYGKGEYGESSMYQ